MSVVRFILAFAIVIFGLAGFFAAILSAVLGGKRRPD
jgi:hypothetical protein